MSSENGIILMNLELFFHMPRETPPHEMPSEKKPPVLIEEHVDHEKLTGKEKEILALTRNFCKDAGQDFAETFVTLVRSLKEHGRPLPESIERFLHEKDFFSPVFTIFNGEAGETFLRTNKLSHTLEPGHFLVVFRLPKPLDYYWWKGRMPLRKGEEEPDDGSENVEGAMVEWGYFYRALLPTVWETQGHYMNETDLFMQRVNEVGDHEKLVFYYVWDFAERPWYHRAPKAAPEEENTWRAYGTEQPSAG